MKRRVVLDFFLGGGLIAFLGTLFYPVARFLFPLKGAAARVDALKVAKVSDIKLNTARTFRYGSRVGILVRTSSGEFRAFDAQCTHLSCTVQYRSDLEHFWCACHNGHFDLVGRNIEGPPPRPLHPFDVSLKGEEIFVTAKKVV